MTARTRQIAVAVLVLLLIVLFLQLPKQPSSASETTETTTNEVSDVAKAVEMVQMGENPMEGILALRQIAEEDSSNIEAQLWLGIFSLQSGQLDKARERFEKVKAIDPNQPEAYWQLGQMEMEAGNYLLAIPNFKRSVELDSSYVNGMFFIAKSYEEAGLKEEAIAYYQDYLPFAPDSIVHERVSYFIEQLNKDLKN